ncbi:MAG: prephenate dehydrogenase/arogenate dehydrogenase family protein [Syntrophaceae bacterium]|nr:prephenate dehydrogenase/arogenate dehydrogenase family protein [Syntrophaceae bacterium]
MDTLDFFNTTIGIIGCKGRMGSWFFNQFSSAGLRVIGIDKTNLTELSDFVTLCDINILAVPVPEISKITKLIGPLLKQHSLLMDIASLKEKPLRSMMDHCQCEIIGTHPMFGPSAESFKDQLCYVCEVRSDYWLPRIVNLLTQLGARIKFVTPTDHDRLMATVQTLRHVIMTSLALTLRETGFDLLRDSTASGSWFREMIKMMTHQFDQPSELYADLALNNPYSHQILQTFENENNKIVQAISRGERENILRLMTLAQSYASRQNNLSTVTKKTLGDVE